MPQRCVQPVGACEFCLISVHLSICSSLAGLSSLESVFHWEIDSSHSLFMTGYTAEMHWHMRS